MGGTAHPDASGKHREIILVRRSAIPFLAKNAGCVKICSKHIAELILVFDVGFRREERIIIRAPGLSLTLRFWGKACGTGCGTVTGHLRVCLFKPAPEKITHSINHWKSSPDATGILFKGMIMPSRITL